MLVCDDRLRYLWAIDSGDRGPGIPRRNARRQLVTGEPKGVKALSVCKVKKGDPWLPVGFGTFLANEAADEDAEKDRAIL